MFKRLIVVCFIVLSLYIIYLMARVNSDLAEQQKKTTAASQPEKTEAYKIYNFSFSKYNMTGQKELEIEGESADMLARIVSLHNVIAKAYAEDMPVTITADDGTFDKSTSVVQLQKNVVATTDDGVRLKTETLNIHTDTNTIETESFAEIERGDMTLEGEGATCQQNFSKIEFNKKVRVVVNDNSDQKITITCDGELEIDYDKNIATFKKNVSAIDKNGQLNSDFMDVYYDKVMKQVGKIYAYGNVEIIQNDNKTYSDTVVYLVPEGRVILGGEPEAYIESQPEGLGVAGLDAVPGAAAGDGARQKTEGAVQDNA